ncbi:MAG: hypothetical protein J5J00_09200 [Deltaproteobacteria bacterium]|nr:hypothetical protein [Deltaproteobacteria bacterium]
MDMIKLSGRYCRRVSGIVIAAATILTGAANLYAQTSDKLGIKIVPIRLSNNFVPQVEADLESCPYLRDQEAKRAAPPTEIFAGPYREIAPLADIGTIKFLSKETPDRHYVYLSRFHGASILSGGFSTEEELVSSLTSSLCAPPSELRPHPVAVFYREGGSNAVEACQGIVTRPAALCTIRLHRLKDGLTNLMRGRLKSASAAADEKPHDQPFELWIIPEMTPEQRHYTIRLELLRMRLGEKVAEMDLSIQSEGIPGSLDTESKYLVYKWLSQELKKH